jgi:small nuclear ribonucleoprotein (snRNP)-like protein
LARTGDFIIDGRSSLCSLERGDVLGVRRRVDVIEEGREMSGRLRNADDEMNVSDNDITAPSLVCREGVIIMVGRGEKGVGTNKKFRRIHKIYLLSMIVYVLMLIL